MTAIFLSLLLCAQSECHYLQITGNPSLCYLAHDCHPFASIDDCTRHAIERVRDNYKWKAFQCEERSLER